MRLIARNPEMTTRQLAEEVGISNGSAYYVLTALVEKGFLKLGRFEREPAQRSVCLSFDAQRHLGKVLIDP
jgi:DNA-binding IclR family transcriptional regulator